MVPHDKHLEKTGCKRKLGYYQERIIFMPEWLKIIGIILLIIGYFWFQRKYG